MMSTVSSAHGPDGRRAGACKVSLPDTLQAAGAPACWMPPAGAFATGC